MNFNVHPIFVHFPIALLSIYSVFEFIRFKKIKKLPYWFYLKATMVILGFIGAVLAAQTGDIAKAVIDDPATNPIIHVHEMWAKATIVIFGILAAAYFVAWLWTYPMIQQKVVNFKIIQLIRMLQQIIMRDWLVILLSAAGLIALIITGSLGGSIVYGFQSDPFTQLIGKLFFGM